MLKYAQCIHIIKHISPPHTNYRMQVYFYRFSRYTDAVSLVRKRIRCSNLLHDKKNFILYAVESPHCVSYAHKQYARL